MKVRRAEGGLEGRLCESRGVPTLVRLIFLYGTYLVVAGDVWGDLRLTRRRVGIGGVLVLVGRDGELQMPLE